MKGLFVLQFVLTNEYDFRRSHRNVIDLKKKPDAIKIGLYSLLKKSY